MESLELVDSLGICGSCQAVVSVTEYAGDESMNAKWLCRCRAPLTHEAFGYNKGTEGAKKVRWVGPDGTWTDKRPRRDFTLGNTHVVLKMPSFLF
jgi:hypothetical protein